VTMVGHMILISQ